MILSKNYETIYDDYCFMDSIVTGIHWDSNLLDLVVTLDYYWDIQEGKTETRELMLRFKNCIEANFSMPQISEIKNISDDKIKVHTWFLYTITGFEVRNDNGLIEVSVKTNDGKGIWLFVKCMELWIETNNQLE